MVVAEKVAVEMAAVGKVVAMAAVAMAAVAMAMAAEERVRVVEAMGVSAHVPAVA
jgi:hypothetical protein